MVTVWRSVQSPSSTASWDLGPLQYLCVCGCGCGCACVCAALEATLEEEEEMTGLHNNADSGDSKDPSPCLDLVFSPSLGGFRWDTVYRCLISSPRL